MFKCVSVRGVYRDMRDASHGARSRVTTNEAQQGPFPELEHNREMHMGILLRRIEVVILVVIFLRVTAQWSGWEPVTASRLDGKFRRRSFGPLAFRGGSCGLPADRG